MPPFPFLSFFMPFSLSDFDFELPPELIAQEPLATRSASRLLRVAQAGFFDEAFCDVIEQLCPHDLLVLNDTQVIHARLFGKKESGGELEVLVERIASDTELVAQIRASRSPKPSSYIVLEECARFLVLGRTGEDQALFRLRWENPQEHHASLLAFLEAAGKLPLPPYMKRAPNLADEARYQTVFAKHPGAVAAPTAGLHFDETLLAKIVEKGVKTAFVTLHVGAGTFLPVRTETLSEHKMHAERYWIPEETVAKIETTRQLGGRVIAVGTTSLRALEAGSTSGKTIAGEGETSIFITPGFSFQCVDALITNFHLPKSTLLMLVSAFAGFETIRKAYAHAIEKNYRFFSYGDAMFLEKALP